MAIRIHSACLAAFFSTVFICTAQDPPPPGQSATVSGSVTNDVTGEAIPRAHVGLWLSGDRRGTETFGGSTDASGHFLFPRLPAGEYSAQASRVGFMPPVEGRGTHWENFTLRTSDKHDQLQLKLTPTGSISGRVVDPDGEPLESIRVLVEFTTGVFMQPGQSPEAITDDKGESRIGGLPPGKYYLKAGRANAYLQHLPPEIRTDGSVEQHLMSTYYPSAMDRKSANRLSIKAGAEMDAVEIRMRRSPAVCISGTVAGVPQGGHVTLRQFLSQTTAPVRADGTFAIWNVDPGKYHISASAGKQLSSASVPLEVTTANIEHLDLRLFPPVDIAGQAIFESDEVRQPAPWQRQRQLPLGIELRRVDDFGPDPRADFAEDGRFRLLHLSPGQYRVRLTSGGPAFVESMWLGQAAMEGDLLDLSGGVAPGATLNIRVGLATGEISGTVMDSTGPATGVRVFLFPGEEAVSTRAQSSIDTGDDGVYRFTAVPPGKYKLLSLEGWPVNGLQSLEDEYADVIETVELARGGKITKDLKRKSPRGS